jgi:hypothetical protein
MAGDFLSDTGAQIGVIAASIVGLATVAVILSRGSQTAQVLTAAGGAFAGVLGAATAPVTGSGGVGSGLLTSGSYSTGSSGGNLGISLAGGGLSIGGNLSSLTSLFDTGSSGSSYTVPSNEQ